MFSRLNFLCIILRKSLVSQRFFLVSYVNIYVEKFKCKCNLFIRGAPNSFRNARAFQDRMEYGNVGF